MTGINRTQRDHERCERMEVEFIGGPHDGSRLFLDVVKEGPGELRVLEMGYYGPSECTAADVRQYQQQQQNAEE